MYMLVVILKSIGMSCIPTSSSSSPSGTVSSTGAERLFLALEAAVGGGAVIPVQTHGGTIHVVGNRVGERVVASIPGRSDVCGLGSPGRGTKHVEALSSCCNHGMFSRSHVRVSNT